MMFLTGVICSFYSSPVYHSLRSSTMSPMGEKLLLHKLNFALESQLSILMIASRISFNFSGFRLPSMEMINPSFAVNNFDGRA